MTNEIIDLWKNIAGLLPHFTATLPPSTQSRWSDFERFVQEKSRGLPTEASAGPRAVSCAFVVDNITLIGDDFRSDSNQEPTLWDQVCGQWTYFKILSDAYRDAGNDFAANAVLRLVAHKIAFSRQHTYYEKGPGEFDLFSRIRPVSIRPHYHLRAWRKYQEGDRTYWRKGEMLEATDSMCRKQNQFEWRYSSSTNLKVCRFATHRWEIGSHRLRIEPPGYSYTENPPKQWDDLARSVHYDTDLYDLQDPENVRAQPTWVMISRIAGYCKARRFKL